MKNLKVFNNENELLEARKNFLSLPNISLEEESNQLHFYNPSENEAVFYFVTEPSMGRNVQLVLFDELVPDLFEDIWAFYDGNQINIERGSDTFLTVVVDATKRNIHQVIVKCDSFDMTGSLFPYSNAVAIDYPKNTGTNYLDAFGNCPNLTSIRLMNELPSSIQIDTFPSYTSNEGVLYYNSKYDYSQIINNLHSGWTAVAI